MGKQQSCQGLWRWFERRGLRSRLKRLGLAEPELDLSWARSGSGFRVDGLNQVGMATVQPEGDGSLLKVSMAKDCSYGWRVSYHGDLRSARREVEGQAWYAACLALAEAEERRRDEAGRQAAAERLERELGLDRREAP